MIEIFKSNIKCLKWQFIAKTDWLIAEVDSRGHRGLVWSACGREWQRRDTNHISDCCCKISWSVSHVFPFQISSKILPPNFRLFYQSDDDSNVDYWRLNEILRVFIWMRNLYLLVSWFYYCSSSLIGIEDFAKRCKAGLASEARNTRKQEQRKSHLLL